MDEFLNQSKKFLSFPLVRYTLMGLGVLIGIGLIIPPLFTKAKETIVGKEPSKEREEKAKEATKLGFPIERGKQLYDIACNIADAFHVRTRPAFDLWFMPDISQASPYYWWEDKKAATEAIKLIKSKEEFNLVSTYYLTKEVTPTKRILKADIIKYLPEQNFQWLWS